MSAGGWAILAYVAIALAGLAAGVAWRAAGRAVAAERSAQWARRAAQAAAERRRPAGWPKAVAAAPIIYRNPDLPPPADPADPYAPDSALLAQLDYLEQRGDGVVQVRDLDGEPAQREVDLDVLSLADPDHRPGVAVGGRIDELELRAGSAQQLANAGIGEGHVGLGVPVQGHEASPSVGRSSGGAGVVGGAPGASTPGADVPTVGAPTDTPGVVSAPSVLVEGPAGGGEASAPSPAAAPRFGRVEGRSFPEAMAGGWTCSCGAAGFLLQGASEADVAGYEEDYAAHAEVCSDRHASTAAARSEQ